SGEVHDLSSLQACKYIYIYVILHILRLVFMCAYLKKYLQATILFPIIVDHVSRHGQRQRWSWEKYPCRASGGLAARAWTTRHARRLRLATVVLAMDGRSCTRGESRGVAVGRRTDWTGTGLSAGSRYRRRR